MFDPALNSLPSLQWQLLTHYFLITLLEIVTHWNS